MVTKNANIFLKKYVEEGYYIYFNKDTGFNIRSELKDMNEPFISKHGPELLDISITNWCDKECEFCYRSATKNGKFMTLQEFELVLEQAVQMDTLQIALGGGNPNQHPEFINFLRIAREKYGIVPSYTTNGRGLTEDIMEATKKYCGAVAVSAYLPWHEMELAINKLIKKGIKTNIHFLLTSESINIAIEWLNEVPEFLRNINAIVFLNYKPVGRNKFDERLLVKNNKNYKEFYSLIETKRYPFKIGFDSCSVSGIVEYMNINENYIEACEAGRFSAFISEDLKLYPCSFMIESMEGIDLRKTQIIDAWNINEHFNSIRTKMRNNSCKGMCTKEVLCKGGCPIFEQITLCSIKNKGD